MARKPVTQSTETEVLLHSRRRGAICFGLHRNTEVKSGQIAHLDQDNTNAKFENLVFLCLEHHDEYDGKTSQSKGLTKGEVKRFWDELYAFVATEPQLAWPDYPAVKNKSKALKRPSLSSEPTFRIDLCNLSDFCVFRKVLYNLLTMRGDSNARPTHVP
jgi:hypothetical protein